MNDVGWNVNEKKTVVGGGHFLPDDRRRAMLGKAEQLFNSPGNDMMEREGLIFLGSPIGYD